MTHIRAWALFGVVLFAGCRQNAPPATATAAGASITPIVGGETIHSASFWMKEGEVAVVVAPTQPGQKDQEYSYVILVKHDWAADPEKDKGNWSISTPLETAGKSAAAACKIKIEGRSFELAERFLIDRQAKAISYEGLDVNGKPQGSKAGRVFLVDLTAEPPTVEERVVDLSGPAADIARDKAAIETAALRARETVTQKDEGARRFVAAMK
jgi:hypothetical protein